MLLLADQGEPPAQRVLRLPGIDHLARLGPNWRTSTIEVQSRRWAHVFDEEAEAAYADLKASEDYVRLGALGSVDIGVVTGANKYFVVSNERLRSLGLPAKYTLPIIERSRDVPGLRVKRGETRKLLMLNGTASSDFAVQAYLAEGVRQGIPDGYKCGKRRLWYEVPLPRQRPHAFLPYMVNSGPRLIVSSGEWSTNLLHGVTLEKPDTAWALAVAMLSSVTQLRSKAERTAGAS
jgi:hypothetical protein